MSLNIGHLNAKLPKELMKKLKLLAALEGLKMNDMVIKVVEEYVNKRGNNGQ